MGRGEGEGSIGAADMARGVGNGLGVVRTVRVIAGRDDIDVVMMSINRYAAL